MNSNSWHLLTKISLIALAFAIILGAFGAHGLKGQLGLQEMGIYEKAIFYHLTQALGLFAIPIAVKGELLGERRAYIAWWILFLGMTIFCGTLYLYVLSGISTFAMVTPLGGIAMILGWLAAAWSVKS